MVEFLLEHGADVCVTTKDGKRPVDLAQSAVVKALLQSAASSKSKTQPSQEAPPPKSQKVSMQSGVAQTRFDKSAGSSSNTQVKKEVVKGRAAVDASCPVAQFTHVYEDQSGGVYDALLNQADIANVSPSRCSQGPTRCPAERGRNGFGMTGFIP